MKTTRKARGGNGNAALVRDSDSVRAVPTGQPFVPVAAMAFCAVAIGWLYAPSLGFAFIGFDDTAYVMQHAWVRAGLRWQGFATAFASDGGIYWQPLTWLSHMLDVSLFGIDSGAHHLQNIVWHVGATLLLFGVARLLALPVWAALACALLWALHPLRVESVAWVAGRKDVLSGFFFLLCVWLYIGYTKSPSVARYASMLAAAALGYLAKPTIVTLPFVLLLFDWWPLRRSVRGMLLIEKLPLFALSLAVAWLTYFSQKQAGALDMLRETTLLERLQNAIAAYGWYLSKTLWPTDLAVIYPYPAAVPALAWVGSAMLVAAITAAAIYLRHRLPSLLVGWLGFQGMLVPMIGLLQAGSQPYADRFTYIASLPLTLGLVAALTVLLNAAPASRQSTCQLLGIGLACAAILMLSVRTHQQVSTWRDGETAFAHAFAAVEGNTVAAMNLGALRIARGAYAEALGPLEMAARTEPHSAIHHYNLGAALAGLGRRLEAERELRRSTQLDPTRAEAWRLLGATQKDIDKRHLAIRSLSQAVRAGLDARSGVARAQPDRASLAAGRMGLGSGGAVPRRVAKRPVERARPAQPDRLP
ncbi:MAG: hypothetical protein U5J83_01970 [Bryobacterales bacterium]|nr:hypothetical protein [Bryobacterales bacterium]